MSKNTIAVVQLSPGEVGYYDELSRIHLTIGHPSEAVEAGTNCTQLRRSVKSGRLRLVSGSLGVEVPPFKLVRDGGRFILAKNDEIAPSIVVSKPKKAVEEAKVAKDEVEESKVAEEVKEEKPAAKNKKAKKEDAVEAAPEEAVAEEPKKAPKKSTKKAKKEEAEVKAAE